LFERSELAVASLRRIEDSHFLSGLNFSLFLSLLLREKKGIEVKRSNKLKTNNTNFLEDHREKEKTFYSGGVTCQHGRILTLLNKGTPISQLW